MIPAEFEIEAMAAVGKPGNPETLPEKLRAKEAPNERRAISESVHEGRFSFPTD
jgi:hypothetical protein